MPTSIGGWVAGRAAKHSPLSPPQTPLTDRPLGGGWIFLSCASLGLLFNAMHIYIGQIG